jgi:hypothetical protein
LHFIILMLSDDILFHQHYHILKEYEPTITPPASQEIDNSEETVSLLKDKLRSLFDKLDKKEEPEEEEKVSKVNSIKGLVSYKNNMVCQ